jgi:hypothetical protein
VEVGRGKEGLEGEGGEISSRLRRKQTRLGMFLHVFGTAPCRLAANLVLLLACGGGGAEKNCYEIGLTLFSKAKVNDFLIY